MARAQAPARRRSLRPFAGTDSCGVGFIANIEGKKSHQIVSDAINILCNLEHRGAVGADPRAGDGAGILVQIPHAFFARKAKALGFRLPKPGDYAVGALFMPRETAWRKVIQSIIADQIKAEQLTLLGWRDVPVDNSSLGETVKPTGPAHMQVFIGRGAHIKNEDEFERQLYILRKSISQASSANTIPTCMSAISRARWRGCISVFRPIRSRPGRWRIRPAENSPR